MAARLFGAPEQERQIDHAELGNAIGQIAARLIAQCQQPMLHQPQNILRPVTEVHDVPDVFDVDAVAELDLESIADELQRTAEPRRRRSVTAHANLDRIAHSAPRPGSYLLRSSPILDDAGIDEVT
jgi:hypothetical protein